MPQKSPKRKIGIITSKGGHLFQMYRLKKWWSKYDRFWVTFPGADTNSFLRGEHVYFTFYPESRNAINAIRNTFLAISILKKEKPDILISFGAGIAPPFFYIGKLMGIKLIFIEPYDFVKSPCLSGRMVSPIVDKMLVQHKMQLSFYKGSEYWGSTL
ncbi:UDP-N-acetylglucosamine--LPS N-acetylglucosamine transferase [Patescibacteria group bacterium]|nr:UDP-N-acetylglucosamine--LPS N-acetylglucosamine transferase [Patescibacteria group bacterium]